MQQADGSQDHPRFDRHDRSDPALHGAGQFGADPQQVGLTETGAQVISGGDTLFHHRGVFGPGRLLGHLAVAEPSQQRSDREHRQRPHHRKDEPGRPPRQAGDDPHGHRADDGADCIPELPADERTDVVGVVVDAVQYLTHGLFGQVFQRLVQRRGQEIGAQAALGTIDDTRPTDPAHGVQDRSAEQTAGQDSDRRPQRVGRDPADGHRAQGLQGCGDGQRYKCRACSPSPQTPPVDGAVERLFF